MLPGSATAVAGDDSVGKILRATREKQDIELSEVAEALKLSQDLLGRIENDDVASIPAVFLRGYVRNYARHLGLDSGALLSLLPEHEEDIVPATDSSYLAEQASRRRTVMVAGVTFLLLLASAAYIYGYRQPGIATGITTTTTTVDDEDSEAPGAVVSEAAVARDEVEVEVEQEEPVQAEDLPLWRQ